jgi:hypothetical protein
MHVPHLCLRHFAHNDSQSTSTDIRTDEDLLENPSVLNIRNEEELHHVLEELRNTQAHAVPEAAVAQNDRSSSSSSLDEDDSQLSEHLDHIEELNIPW